MMTDKPNPAVALHDGPLVDAWIPDSQQAVAVYHVDNQSENRGFYAVIIESDEIADCLRAADREQLLEAVASKYPAFSNFDIQTTP